MGRYVRPGDRKHQRTTVWAAGILVVLVTAALAVVLPAVGSDTSPPDGSGGVAPASTLQKVLPSIANVGGSNFSCNSAGTSYVAGSATPPGMEEFQIVKATPGMVVTDPDTGVTFKILSPSAGKDPKTTFSFEVSGGAAVVYHVGVKGGTKVSWYDYFNNAPFVPADGVSRGVSSDTNLHSSPDSQYNASAVPPKFTFNVASITTFCYRALGGVTPSCDESFDGHSLDDGLEYSAQLQRNAAGQCKSEGVVMFTAFDDNGERFATLHPVAPGGELFKVVEHIAWRGYGAVQNPEELWYDDTSPFDGADKRTMLLCETDPRPDPVGNPFDLPAVPWDDAGVMPAPLPGDLKGPHTTCMLESTDSAPAAGDPDSSRKFSAWLYSKIDGSRGGFGPG